MTKNEYLQKNILELLENPQLEQMTPEARAYIEREAKKTLVGAYLRGLGVGGIRGITELPGEFLTPPDPLDTLATFGTWPVVRPLLTVPIKTLGTGMEYLDSRSRYKYLADKLHEMEKSAATVNYGGMLGRTVAEEGKKRSGLGTMLIPAALDNAYTKGTVFGKIRDDDDKAQLYQAILDRMVQANPDELHDLVVHLGAQRALQDTLRSMSNPRAGKLEKIRNIFSAPANLLTTTGTNIDRSDHYNPLSNTITLYSDSPAVLTHEIGHAIDFNRQERKKRRKYIYDQDDKTTLKKEERANAASGKNLEAAFKDEPDILSALQVLRLRMLPRGYYSYNSEFDPYTMEVTNKYMDKGIGDVAKGGHIVHKHIKDEHMDLPSADLVKLLKEKLLNKGK